MSETYFLFPPSRHANSIRYALHLWDMDGNTLRETVSVESFSAVDFRFMSGALVPLPPAALVARVKEIRASGKPINGAEGWEHGGWG